MRTPRLQDEDIRYYTVYTPHLQVESVGQYTVEGVRLQTEQIYEIVESQSPHTPHLQLELPRDREIGRNPICKLSGW